MTVNIKGKKKSNKHRPRPNNHPGPWLSQTKGGVVSKLSRGTWGQKENHVQDKRDMPHLTIRQPLLPIDAQRLEPRTRSLDIRHANRNMTKSTTRLGISRAIPSERCIGLSSMVVRQFEDTYTYPPINITERVAIFRQL